MNLRLLASLVIASALFSGGIVAAQDPSGRAESAAPRSAGDDADTDTDADASEVSEGGSKVKVFRFSGLDISGRLKSPQLLYFLNRLRAEFDRPRLPHRSFMPELQRTTKTKSL